jgi:hypothetical protein
MPGISKFDHIDGKPDEEQIENWVEEYFHNMLNILNTFFTVLDLKEALARMKAIPFESLIKEQLEDESEEVLKIAVARLNELLAIEIEFREYYVNYGTK